MAKDRIINLTIPAQTISIGDDKGLAFSWKDMELSRADVSRSVLFSVGEIADPPVLSKTPFSFTLEAEGKRALR